MPAPPKWAQDLVLQVALDEGRDDVPDLTWHRARSRPGVLYGDTIADLSHTPQQSSGRASRNRIHVTAGTDRKDQKLVLLHELAHWLTPGEHHSARFWDKAWELYRRYKVPLRYARVREGSYRKGALVAARRRR